MHKTSSHCPLIMTTALPSLRADYVSTILAHESTFLEGMDKIVFQYDEEAQKKVRELKETEYFLLVISLLIIIIELIFIFRPLARSVRATVQDLMASEESSRKMTRELSKLYEELGKSYQDLEAVNLEPESPSLYASMSAQGEFTYLAPRFLHMMEYEETEPPKTFQQLLKSSGYKDDFIKGLMQLLQESKNWTGEIRLITEPGDFCWVETFLIPIAITGEIKMISHDITEFKEAKIRSRELNRERIEKSVKEQQYRSVLILKVRKKNESGSPESYTMAWAKCSLP